MKLINADDFVEWLLADAITDEQREFAERVRHAAAKMKPVDAVPVVRCRDCKHSPLKTWFDCPMAHLPFDGDRWCWKGEREEGEQA